MMRAIIGLLSCALLLQACSKELKSRYTMHRYVECGAFYQVLSLNFKNSVQQGIGQVGETMYAAGRVSIERAYAKEEAGRRFIKEKEKQLAFMEKIFAEQDTASVRTLSDRCDELASQLIGALKEKK